MSHPFDARPIISDAGLSERWNKSLRTLARMRRSRTGPPWFRIGASVFYRLDDVHAFEESRLQKTEGAE